MTTFEELLEQAEEREQPVESDRRQEDDQREVPDCVDIEEHRKEGV